MRCLGLLSSKVGVQERGQVRSCGLKVIGRANVSLDKGQLTYYLDLTNKLSIAALATVN